MAYTKQTWACGDTITAEKLNHMEDGIAEGGGSEKLVVNLTETEGTYAADKTWQEIYDAFPNVCIYEDNTYKSVISVLENDAANIYNVNVSDIDSNNNVVIFKLLTNSRTGYPAYVDNGN